jgi:hypothetical protein
MPCRQVGALALCVCLVACDLDFLIVSPGTVIVGGAPNLALRPISPFPQTVPFPTCPSVQPVVARFEIVLSNGGADHDIDRLDASFSDWRGSPGSSVSLTGREITEQFGTPLVAAGRDRVIVIVLGVGCSTQTTGTIIVRVRLHDRKGTSLTLSEQLPVTTNEAR